MKYSLFISIISIICGVIAAYKWYQSTTIDILDRNKNPELHTGFLKS